MSSLDAYGSGPDPAWLQIDWTAHQSWVVVDGAPVNVIDVGPKDAPVLLFVHGHSACWQHWLEQLPAFMGTHRCVALDLPGFGRSPIDPPVSVQRFARAMDGVCEELGIAAACVVGNSMGGFIAAELAISFPRRVERLVLVAAAGLSGKYIGLPTAVIRHPGGVMLGRVLLGLGGLTEGQRRLLSRRARGRRAAIGFVCARAEELHPALVAELLTGAGRAAGAPAAVDLATYDFRERVPDIACPTLIVWGDRDRLVPTSCSAEYERAIPDSRRVIYDGTGHLPMLERPARFNADLAAFLAEEPGEVRPGRAQGSMSPRRIA
jgi:pimeloyl-ACP methyl ester carboxylesterase